MSALDSFKVQSAPAAFAPTAAAHNRVVSLIESMVGQNGVKVTISEGRILIEYDAKTAPTNGSGGGSGSTDAATVHNISGTRTVTIANGIEILTTPGYTMQLQAEGITITDTGTSKQVNLSPGAHSVSLVEIDVCDAGVAKKMLVIGSAPY